jgi:hypothetical protein
MRLLGGSMDQLESVGKGGEPEISVRNARAVRASHVQVSAVNAHRVGAVFHNKKKGNARTSVQSGDMADTCSETSPTVSLLVKSIVAI